MKRVPGIGALLAILAAMPLAAQESATVRGRVVEAQTQQPLTGVVVSVGTRSSLTRLDGTYQIAGVPAGSDTLRARMIGYASVMRPITVARGQTLEVNITLASQVVSLAEIVVTGYGEQRAGNITGAVTQVSAADFNTGRIVSPEELIRNKVPGVQVEDNNEPGGGLALRIRGPTSINASSEPLFVIDGVPIAGGAGGGLSAGRNPLNFLDPNEIESITVLRDASAAAIYGANAANGVVLIQTKTGKSNTQFEYTGSMSTSSVTRLPTMLNAEEFRAAVTQYAPQNVSQLQNASTDWFDLVTRTSFGQEHHLAVSGASERTNWRLSGGFLNQDGVILGTTTERVNLGVNMDQRLFQDRLTIRASVKGSRAKDLFTPGGVLSNAAQMGPTQPVTDATSATGFANWPGNKLTSADNPVEILSLAVDRGVTYRSLGNVSGRYSVPFVEGLQANLNLNYDVIRTDRQTFSPSTLHSELKTGNGGTDYRANQSMTNAGAESYLNFRKPLGSIPGTIDVTGGYSYGWSHGEYPWFRATGLSTNVLGGNGVTSAKLVTNFQDIQESKLASFFGRVNYNYNDRYLISASIRRDGSSRFGTGNQWGTFPAVSLGWRLSEESFLKGKVQDLKLRASWAKTGNQAFGNYLQYSTYLLGDAQTQIQFGNGFVPTIRPSAVDPNIKWEATDAFDIGLDFSIIGNALTGTVDWYTKKTKDLIFTVPVAAGTNLSNFVTTNIGSMRNRGVELSLSARVKDGGRRGFSWTADFTAARNSNRLVAINPAAGGVARILTGNVAGGVGTFIQVLQPGVPVNSFYVFEHKRGADGKPLYADNTGLDSEGKFNNTPDGTINEQDLYVDQNGDQKINQDDRRPFHDPAPKWMLGHSSYIGYRNFDLSFTLRSYLGNYVYNNVASNLGTYAEVTRGAPYNLHSSVLETGFVNPQYLSDYYVEDASFLRMDNITVAYRFAYRNQPVRVFATVQNAFTLTGYSGVDPTAGLVGLDNNIYPRARTVTAGLSLVF